VELRRFTRPAPVPFVPELCIYQADDVYALWERAGSLPFWAFAWAGGQALARHVLDHPDLVRGRRVLDLAAGSGLVGLAAARAGAASVTASEVDPLAVAAIEVNAEANGARVTVIGDVLDSAPEADVVLAGDVFYEQPMAARMAAYLRRAAMRGAALAGDPARAYAPRTGFERIAAYDVPVAQMLENTDVKRCFLLRATRP
jgi:predicted nicotinamide N-methyase